MSNNNAFCADPARPAPIKMEGRLAWLRNNLFSRAIPSIVPTCCWRRWCGLATSIVQWGILHAVTAADADACQAARGVGACWGVIPRKAASS
jgi:general L-amino acid transport system permease protein